jgi:hypothetical protein
MPIKNPKLLVRTASLNFTIKEWYLIRETLESKSCADPNVAELYSKLDAKLKELERFYSK